MSAVLEVVGLMRQFGGIVVAQNINLNLEPGDRTALIGPNGAGKTTFVNLVTGALRPSAGRIRLAGEDVTGVGLVGRVRRGLVRTFQITRLFPEVTVAEHVALALLQRRGRAGIVGRDLWDDPEIRDAAEGILADLGIAAVADLPVGEIAYGQQRLVEMAVALALKPKVLLLDEPAAGVPQAESGRIVAALDRLPPDLAVLMIEHDMDLVFRFARRIVALAAGQVIADGTPAEIAADANVRAAYLGSYGARQ